MTPSLARVLFGTDEPVAATKRLRAGPLTLALRNGHLWHICAGDVEIWHGVAFLFRDADWGTPEPIIDRCTSTVSSRAFRIRCTGHFPTKPRVDFHLEFEGTGAGVVRVTGEATPRGDIATNRLGLCVMHPMAAAGRRVDVQHVDGRVSHSTFPTLIPPWPAFMLVRAIRHEYAPSRFARCTFEGDAFEVEDQRNNADASFKTYNRSNMMPRPYVLRAGDVVRQRVELVLETPRARARAKRASSITVRIGREARDLPSIGVEILPDDAAADTLAREARRRALQALRPAHLHLAVDAGVTAVDWNGVAELLQAAGAGLRLDVALGDAAQVRPALAALCRDLRSARVTPDSIAVFPGSRRIVDVARRTFPDVRIGSGTPHFFVQLNRAERLGDVDFLTFTTSSIVHGTDDEAVMTSLSSLPSMIATLDARYPGVPIRVGPSTIGARGSPLGAQPHSGGTRRIALAQRDPRHRGLYGAAWLLGYVAQLATTRTSAITLMSLSGSSGIVDFDDQKPAFRYPAFHVLARLQGAARVHDVSVSEPAHIAALAVMRAGCRELLLANLRAVPTVVDLANGAPARIAVMNANSWRGVDTAGDAWRVVRAPGTGARVSLDAYAVACVRYVT